MQGQGSGKSAVAVPRFSLPGFRPVGRLLGSIYSQLDTPQNVGLTSSQETGPADFSHSIWCKEQGWMHGVTAIAPSSCNILEKNEMTQVMPMTVSYLQPL
jgi:hypothetical protein